ncbi:MAG: flagellar motor switch protein FliG [Oscillospiraceae bacterium]|nr:flagellar motor switch protein FliG [Oscillospiraceae bacterium]
MAKLGKKAKETKEAAAQQIPENEATPAEQAAAVQQLAAPLPSKLELTSPQKAAAVIVSLGADKASQLYKYMEPEDVEQLTVEVAKLGFLDSNQTEDVLNEFLQMCMTNKAVTEGGLEYAKTVLEKAFGTQAAENLLSKVTKSLKNREFAFMNKADVKALFSALQYERAQTIALVLSYVDPDKAAGVVAQLDEKKQIQVVENIAKMESASPLAVQIVEAEMSKKFSSIVTNANVKVGGIDYVADVMNNLDRSSEKNIFDGLSVHNQDLAEEIRKRMFVFEDIITMDDRSVQRFVRDCDPRDLVLALKAANSEVANKLFANMSTRMAQSIQDDLEITSNVRMKDVEEAQQRIVDIIRDLEEKNEIIILKGGKDDIIA